MIALFAQVVEELRERLVELAGKTRETAANTAEDETVADTTEVNKDSHDQVTEAAEADVLPIPEKLESSTEKEEVLRLLGLVESELAVREVEAGEGQGVGQGVQGVGQVVMGRPDKELLTMSRVEHSLGSKDFGDTSVGQEEFSVVMHSSIPVVQKNQSVKQGELWEKHSKLPVPQHSPMHLKQQKQQNHQNLIQELPPLTEKLFTRTRTSVISKEPVRDVQASTIVHIIKGTAKPLNDPITRGEIYPVSSNKVEKLVEKQSVQSGSASLENKIIQPRRPGSNNPQFAEKITKAIFPTTAPTADRRVAESGGQDLAEISRQDLAESAGLDLAEINSQDLTENASHDLVNDTSQDLVKSASQDLVESASQDSRKDDRPGLTVVYPASPAWGPPQTSRSDFVEVRPVFLKPPQTQGAQLSKDDFRNVVGKSGTYQFERSDARVPLSETPVETNYRTQDRNATESPFHPHKGIIDPRNSPLDPLYDSLDSLDAPFDPLDAPFLETVDWQVYWDPQYSTWYYFHRQSGTVYCLLSTVYCLLSTVYVYCLMSTVYCLPDF